MDLAVSYLRMMATSRRFRPALVRSVRTALAEGVIFITIISSMHPSFLR